MRSLRSLALVVVLPALVLPAMSAAAKRVSVTGGSPSSIASEGAGDGVGSELSVRSGGATTSPQILAQLQPAQGGQSGRGPQRDTQLSLVGSKVIGAELMPDLAEAYARSRGANSVEWQVGPQADDAMLTARGPSAAAGTHVRILASSTSAAFTALSDHSADIGMAARPIDNDEWQKLRNQGLGDMRTPPAEHVLAEDALVVVVNPTNPTKSLSVDQLREIFVGRITDWSQIGGPPGPIHLFIPDPAAASYLHFVDVVMHSHKVVPSPASRLFLSPKELSDEVAADAQALGLVSLTFQRNTRLLPLKDKCDQAWDLTPFSVRAEEYPLSRRLVLYTPPGAKSDDVNAFLSWLSSAAAQRIIEDHQFVGPGIIQSGPDYVSRRASAGVPVGGDKGSMMKFSATVERAVRLSTTFRFAARSAEIDAPTQQEIYALAAYTRSPAASGRRLMVLGFADDEGSGAVALDLSRERAVMVASALAQAGVPTYRIVGFGENAPVACRENPLDSAKNRRVEAWFR
jgi:phosphate transport system substrate-binding protein